MPLLSTHLAADQEAIAPASSVFFQKPANFYTKRDAALLNSRVFGQKDAQLHFLTEWPTHYCRSGSRLSPEAIFELRLALRSGRRLTDEETLSLHAASQAGQVVRANLHRTLQSFDVKPPTQKEAATYLQAHFADGADRSWITEYYHRGRGKKAIWTVGDSIHADDFRYVDFDLWVNHFKMKPRDSYLAQGPRHSKLSDFTRWLALDVDNHGTEPTTSLGEWLARYTALHELLVSERMPYLAQVNPNNGSYQLWSPVPKWGLSRVADFAERVYSACPWLREIYPTKSKWQIICPLRPDKVNLLGPGELPKINCRTKAGKTWCYDLIAVWRWHRKPTAIDADAVRSVLAQSFLASSGSTKDKTIVSIPSAKASAPKADAMPKQKSKGPASKPKMAKGRFNNLQGRWLELLSDTYLDGIEPPAMAAVAFLTPQLRLFRDGETETARQFLRDVIHFVRSRGWTFSDRAQNAPEELTRTLDHICQDRLAGNKALKMAALDAARKRLDHLGFDGSFDSLLRALTARRTAGRFSGGLDLPVVENEAVTGAACKLMTLTKTDHHAALMLLRRILNHVAKHQELSYSFLKEIASSTGVRLSNDKAQKVLAILKNGLVKKTKNYSRCPMWSIGNLYAVSEEVQFVTTEAEPREKGCNQAGNENGRQTEISSNYTISRFWTNESLYEPLDMKEIAAEVARLRSNERFTARIRTSRKAISDSTE
jgi:hypothetical protein